MVCFDLGGVLALIRRSWEECVLAASIHSTRPLDLQAELTDFSLFDEFQLGTLTVSRYLSELGEYLGVTSEEALRAHNAILKRQYDGVDEFVGDLKNSRVQVSCLSNTNELHWKILDSAVFPATHALDLKVVSHDIRLLKPDPKVFGLFDQRAGTAPNEVIYFDDNEGNVSAARLHGWNAHFIDHERDPVQQMRRILADLEVL